MLYYVENCVIIQWKVKCGELSMPENKNREKAFLQGEELYNVIVGDGTGDATTAVGLMLTYLGFKNKLIGTQYLKEAILYRYQKLNMARVSLTGEVYLTVADKLNSTVNRVERAIRNSISDCNDNGNLIAFNDLIHCQMVEPQFPPTNGELISSIVNWLQLEKQKGRIR